MATKLGSVVGYRSGIYNGYKVIGTQTLGLRGLVLWLKFNEGSGNIAYDSSFYNNHGTIYGATWTDGKFGKALSFDEVDDYVEVADSDSLKLTNFTITVWIKGHANDVFSRIVSKPTDGTYGGFDFVANKRYTDLLFKYSKAGVGWSGGPSALGMLKEGEWQFFAVRVWNDGTNTYAEILDGSGNILANYTWDYVIEFNTTRPLRIGMDYGKKNPFNGIIDEVRIYNRALSENEIKMLYYNKIGAVPSKAI